MDIDERIYKDYVAQTFNRTAPTYDRVGPRFFSYFGKRLVEVAGVSNGATVLDLGCGGGAILFPSIDKVGRSGKVIGIDIAERMVQRTGDEIKQQGIENARVLYMDAEALQFSSSFFDFVICGFGLYEFYDLNPALSEVFRVLKINGIFAASLWGRNVDKRWDVFRNIVKSYRADLKPVPEAKNIPRLREPAEIEAVLVKFGFSNIETHVEEKEFFFRDVDEWWAFEWSHGNRFLWERMEEPKLHQCKGELFDAISQLQQDAGIPILFQILLTRAEKTKG